MSKTIKIKMPIYNNETLAPCQGQQITFRAPCNCEGVTNLNVDGVVYQLLNTAGTSIDNGNVFVAGVLVSVILDKANQKAYIQNGSFGGGLQDAVIGTNWTVNDITAVKSQRVNVAGITERNNAFVDHSSASIIFNNQTGEYEGYAKYADEEKQYLDCITNGYAETHDGYIEFYIFGDTNNIDIPIMIEVL